MKVLIVDDSTVNNILLENLLQNHGYETHSVLEGSEVMKSIDTFSPDLIILDLMMPGLSGFDILKQINNNSIKLPVIVITAYTDASYAKKSKELGAFAHFTKPFNHQSLINSVKKATSPVS